VTFRENNELLFRAMARASGAALLVDASKGPVRLARLLRDTQLTVSVLQLTRPFADYAFSHKKKYNIGLRDIFRKFADYLSHVRKTDLVQGMGRLSLLRFEDFLANPDELRRWLLATLADIEDSGTDDDGQTVDGFHSVGGNNLRFSPEPLSANRSKVRYESFSVHQRIALRMLDRTAELFRPRSSIISR
jgi:hypothetical protein